MRMDKVDQIRAKVENESSKNKYYSFYQNVIGLGVEDLKKNILLLQKHLQETLVALRTRPEIIAAQEAVKKAEKPYRDKIKEYKEKIKQLKSFVDESICVGDLENQIVINTMKAEDEKIKMSRDAEVIDAKYELDLVKGPYTDAKTILEVKISYLNILIQDQCGSYDE